MSILVDSWILYHRYVIRWRYDISHRSASPLGPPQLVVDGAAHQQCNSALPLFRYVHVARPHPHTWPRHHTRSRHDTRTPCSSPGDED